MDLWKNTSTLQLKKTFKIAASTEICWIMVPCRWLPAYCALQMAVCSWCPCLDSCLLMVFCKWLSAHHAPALHYITLHYRHFERHLQLKWPVVHQQLHVIRNTAPHRPSTQASYTASRVRPKRKISCAAAQIAATQIAAAQIAATLTIS